MKDRLRDALRTATDALLAEMNADGHWEGELSCSALSTATAAIALHSMDPARHAASIRGGLEWLATHQNADGGWGDTIRSKSNISTTALCWAAYGAAGADAKFQAAVERGRAWLTRASGGLARLPEAIAARYGKDRTFSVPILMTLALSGRIEWKHVPHLPFELAAFPHQLFGALRLPVVSYALPALIAIGQAIHHHRRSPWKGALVRDLFRGPALRVLARIQPSNGGFLEATPLTSFVTMSLASAGLANHSVARKGAEFLAASVRGDGSWPIDTNLATWVSTLAVKALSHQPAALSPEQRMALREWLQAQQYRVEHPYTHAAPGGWAWTPLPGGVPDADDTPGALLALLSLALVDSPGLVAGAAGCRWLIDLQNRDGGIPTFCRGWGALPFDRSSPDLTAHTLRAWHAWRPHLTDRRALDRAISRAIAFLTATQRADGSWVPLWFGNEHAPDDENPVYATTHVLTALREAHSDAAPARRAAAWLAGAQNDDGGWGGLRGAPSSTEETALAVEALAGTSETAAFDRGVRWLVERVESGAWREPAPIGFYFAKLWYFERMYPLVWTVGALGKAAAL